ncbi:hypothetical protein [Candidatus Collinsella stercoripullorum]|uniref:hypothetical protein n=1 Tax=Candidatus Collinsella stercoripullorum TaxID=2838522 RepID=UPI0022E77BE0|nr:hypothetical protein [Candidatus Collinsella stercoripullorum]
MDGDNDGAKAQGAAQAGAQDEGAQAAQAQVTGGAEAVGDTDKAREEFEAALADRDARIAELEGQIAEAAKTAENAEKLRAEMDELRRQGDEQRIGFELQIAGARNVKAARALLADYDNDIDKLKAAEPWLFGAGATAPAQAGATGLPNAGAASDEGATVKRWRKIAGIEGDEE